ncbi:hypothetical protein ACWEV3_40870 [Saccharopolyspora sp. NPDC003752]
MNPRTHPIAERARYRACLLGEQPAEVLDTAGRERLVAELHDLGWTDPQIAAHCRMTTYTTARIRDRLRLAPNRQGTRNDLVQSGRHAALAHEGHARGRCCDGAVGAGRVVGE